MRRKNYNGCFDATGARRIDHEVWRTKSYTGNRVKDLITEFENEIKDILDL